MREWKATFVRFNEVTIINLPLRTVGVNSIRKVQKFYLAINLV